VPQTENTKIATFADNTAVMAAKENTEELNIKYLVQESEVAIG
jgi:hypothetical protein